MPSLIAALAAILVAMGPIAQYYRMVEDGNNRAVVAVTAGQFSILLAGIKKYIRAHSNDLINDIPVGSSTAVSLATLTAEHDLPAGFTTTNPYNQTWVAYATQSASGVLDGSVISYGGQTLSPKDAVAIALKAGAQGGYIPPNDLISGLNSGMAVGGGGTWSQSMAGFPNPGAGHLVGLVASADDVNNNPNYLYRVGVPGHDELNTMDVALNMGGNNINNVGTIDAAQGVFSGNVFAQSGNIIDLAATNIVSSGTVQTNQLSSASADIVALAARNVRIDENAQIYGTLNVNGKATMDAAITGTDGGNAIAGNACTDYGAIASSPNGTGAHLECVSGVWKNLGGLSSVVPIFFETFNTKDTGWIANTSGGVLFVSIFGADSENCNQSGYELHSYTTNQGVVDIAKYNGGLFASGNDYFFVEPGESWRVTSDPWNGCQNPTFLARGTLLQ